MDLDIDNYTNNELLELLAIAPAECNNKTLLKKIEAAISEVDETSTSNNEELIDFFRECYMRIAVSKGYQITETIRKTLGLPPAPVIEERPINPILQRQPITAPIVYPGSLPAQEPIVYSVNTVQSEYARGLNDPLKRDTVKHTLILNSKFRQNLTDASRTRSQSDRLSMQTFCSTTNYKMKNVRDTIYQDASACANIESNADRGLTTDYNIELNDPYENVVSLRLAGLEMANTRYNISGIQGTNEFQAMAGIWNDSISGFDTTLGPPEWKTIYISDGNYDVHELKDEINSKLDAVAAPFTAIPGGRRADQLELNYHHLHPDNTNKYNFSVRSGLPALGSANLHYAVSLDFRVNSNPGRPIYMNLGWMMGFREARYDYVTDYVGNATGSLPQLTKYPGIDPSGNYSRPPCDPRALLMRRYTGFNPLAAPNLGGTTFYLLEVDDFNNNNPVVVNYNCTSGYSYNMRNIIAKIPNTSVFEALLFEDSSDRIWKTRKYFGPVRIKKLAIRLLDDNGRPVDLNDGEFVVTLEIETLNMPYKNMVA